MTKMNKNIKILIVVLIILIGQFHDAKPIPEIYTSEDIFVGTRLNSLNRANHKIFLDTGTESIKKCHYNFINDSNSKIKKKLLRKLENNENIIIAWFNVNTNGEYKYIDRVNNINDNEINALIDYVFLDDDTSKKIIHMDKKQAKALIKMLKIQLKRMDKYEKKRKKYLEKKSTNYS